MTLEQRLEKIEAMLLVLVECNQLRQWYSTGEFAQSVGKAEFTIREYCRLGRLRAQKRQSGRGAHEVRIVATDDPRSAIHTLSRSFVSILCPVSEIFNTFGQAIAHWVEQIKTGPE